MCITVRTRPSVQKCIATAQYGSFDIFPNFWNFCQEKSNEFFQVLNYHVPNYQGSILYFSVQHNKLIKSYHLSDITTNSIGLVLSSHTACVLINLEKINSINREGNTIGNVKEEEILRTKVQNQRPVQHAVFYLSFLENKDERAEQRNIRYYNKYFHHKNL